MFYSSPGSIQTVPEPIWLDRIDKTHYPKHRNWQKKCIKESAKRTISLNNQLFSVLFKCLTQQFHKHLQQWTSPILYKILSINVGMMALLWEMILHQQYANEEHSTEYKSQHQNAHAKKRNIKQKEIRNNVKWLSKLFKMIREFRLTSLA